MTLSCDSDRNLNSSHRIIVYIYFFPFAYSGLTKPIVRVRNTKTTITAEVCYINCCIIMQEGNIG